jgi:hypothetical protein
MPSLTHESAPRHFSGGDRQGPDFAAFQVPPSLRLRGQPRPPVMVFLPPDNQQVPHIPDDAIVSDLIFDPRHGRRPLRESNRSAIIDAPSGTAFDVPTMKERTEALAKGLSKELGVKVGWPGVVGVFAPNNVRSIRVLG